MKKTNKMNSALLVIDNQIDFMDLPGSALPVTGAVKDTERLVAAMAKTAFGAIFTSLDTHHTLDISHPAWWKKPDGSFVDPFTVITPDDVREGKFTARIDPARSLQYLDDLKANGEFQHMVWTEHCIEGSAGHALLPIYAQALKEFEMDNLRWVNYIRKGENPFTEHFGIFRANVPMASDPNTNVNQGIFQTLNTFDEIYLSGQARSHCVANSLKQLLEIAPNLASKLIIIEDTMSDVPGLPQDFYNYVQTIYDGAIAKGVRTIKSTDF